MPLIRNGERAADEWVLLDAEEPVPEDGNIIVSLERWQAEREALLARPGRLGIRLWPDQPPHLIADDLAHFALVALELPSFKDGRAYSHARLLRTRYRFRGELRATGEVLRDQILFMVRCGFDAFEVPEDFSPAEWREALSEFTVFYQPAEDSHAPAFRLRHAMRTAAE